MFSPLSLPGSCWCLLLQKAVVLTPAMAIKAPLPHGEWQMEDINASYTFPFSEQ